MKSSSHTPTRRTGFTLVELLVVIAIIAILAALITPAIWRAMTTASKARIKLEVGSISQALEQYKNEMGEYPPDFSEIGANDAETVNLRRNAIYRHLANKYRYRNVSSGYRNVAGPGDDLADADLLQLNPTNALYFWLRGFYGDKQRPLTAGWDANSGLLLPEGRDSRMDFDGSRLITPTQSRNSNYVSPFAYDYVPKGDGSLRPYVYYRATQTVPGSFPYQSALVWSQSSSNTLKAPAPYGSSIQENDFAEPKKYQLISAGLDGNYGDGGRFTVNVAATNPADVVIPGSGSYPAGPYEKADRDNITSFCDKTTLEDSSL